MVFVGSKRKDASFVQVVMLEIRANCTYRARASNKELREPPPGHDAISRARW